MKSGGLGEAGGVRDVSESLADLMQDVQDRMGSSFTALIRLVLLDQKAYKTWWGRGRQPERLFGNSTRNTAPSFQRAKNAAHGNAWQSKFFSTVGLIRVLLPMDSSDFVDCRMGLRMAGFGHEIESDLHVRSSGRGLACIFR